MRRVQFSRILDKECLIHHILVDEPVKQIRKNYLSEFYKNVLIKNYIDNFEKAVSIQEFQDQLNNDYLIPDIEEIDLRQYYGDPGDKIRIRAFCEIQIVKIFIQLSHLNGQVLESGEAMPSENGLDWFYEATKLNNDIDSCIFYISACNASGQVNEQEHQI